MGTIPLFGMFYIEYMGVFGREDQLSKALCKRLPFHWFPLGFLRDGEIT